MHRFDDGWASFYLRKAVTKNKVESRAVLKQWVLRGGYIFAIRTGCIRSSKHSMNGACPSGTFWGLLKIVLSIIPMAREREKKTIRGLLWVCTGEMCCAKPAILCHRSKGANGRKTRCLKLDEGLQD